MSRPWRRVTPLFWSKASKEKRRAMVVAEVTRAEQEHHNNKAVSQSRQGSWISWEGATDRPMSWFELWEIPHTRLRMPIRSTYHTLPCPRNLHQWLGTEETYPLCSAINASLQHILLDCKIALPQGRHSDLVLRKLTEVEESCRQEVNRRPSAPARLAILFARTWEKTNPTRHRGNARLISTSREWTRRVNLG